MIVESSILRICTIIFLKKVLHYVFESGIF